MKKLLSVPVVVAVLVVGAVIGGLGAKQVAASQDFGQNQGQGNGGNNGIVGVWEVDAAAPYRPHLFTFNADGTMLSTNPTNVQENPASPHGGTNDSVGMGVWKEVKQHNQRYVVGTFEELNAFADNHQKTDVLHVSFKVQLTNNGQGFDGPASALLGDNVKDTVGSHLTGVRVNIDQAAVDALAL
jgi:hypothetical protein